MTSIIPAVIPQTSEDLHSHVARVRGKTTRMQIDVLDGRYVPGRVSWPYNKRDQDAWKKLTSGEEGLPFWEDISYEIDMMVKEPEANMDDWIAAGAETLIIHVESTTTLEEIFKKAEAFEVAIALALRPSTDERVLEPWLEHIAFVQVMGSDTIGRQGISLEEEKVCTKISAIHARYPALRLGVDIGVNEDTIPPLVRAGASHLVAGSAIFEHGDPRAQIALLQNAIEKAEG